MNKNDIIINVKARDHVGSKNYVFFMNLFIIPIY